MNLFTTNILKAIIFVTLSLLFSFYIAKFDFNNNKYFIANYGLNYLVELGVSQINTKYNNNNNSNSNNSILISDIQFSPTYGVDIILNKIKIDNLSLNKTTFDALEKEKENVKIVIINSIYNNKINNSFKNNSHYNNSNYNNSNYNIVNIHINELKLKGSFDIEIKSQIISSIKRKYTIEYDFAFSSNAEILIKMDMYSLITLLEYKIVSLLGGGNNNYGDFTSTSNSTSSYISKFIKLDKLKFDYKMNKFTIKDNKILSIIASFVNIDIIKGKINSALVNSLKKSFEVWIQNNGNNNDNYNDNYNGNIGDNNRSQNDNYYNYFISGLLRMILYLVSSLKYLLFNFKLI